nr:hypothetical protein BaRGS_018098 [Batillaria attramentaria]
MSQRLTEVSAEVQALKNTNTHQDAAIQEAGSSVYVRWGRSVCPNSTHLVYSGVIGGSYFNHDGAASNVLCLTMSPVFSNHAIPGEHSMLYGGEYETWDSHYQKDPVCVVCRSRRPTVIMVPGTNVCMPGWTLEYSGFLMANHYVYKAGTDYICVDSALENRVGGDANQDGVLLHYTRTACGSLPCSPYVNNKVSSYADFKGQQKDVQAQTHDMSVRSDDTTPLEPVVTQLSQRLTEVSAEVQAMKNTNTQQDAAIQEAGSSVYVRWGRSVCPSSTHLVYSGVVGGSCVAVCHASPNAAFKDEQKDTHSIKIAQTHDMAARSDDRPPLEPVVTQLSQRLTERPTTIMVPGTNVCMPGWTLEYSGLLMADYYGWHAGTDYICVDSAMEERGAVLENVGWGLVGQAALTHGCVCHSYPLEVGSEATVACAQAVDGGLVSPLQRVTCKVAEW